MKFFGVIVLAGCFFLGTLSNPHSSSCLAQESEVELQTHSDLGSVLIQVGDELVSLDQFAATNQQDPKLKAYFVERVRTPDTLEGQASLAELCDKHGLSEQKDAHLQRALVHDPDNSEIRRELGHTNVDGKWLSHKQIHSELANAKAAHRRLNDWKKPVAKISKLFRSPSKKIQQNALAQLNSIDDPRSITAIETILSEQNELAADGALHAIAKFPQREATESVMRNALFSPWPAIRAKAFKLLRERNQFDFVPPLLGQLVSPISTRFEITEDARGNALYRFALFQRNMDQDAIRQFETLLQQNRQNVSRRFLQPDLFQRAWERAGQAEQVVARLNNQIESKNSAIQTILAESTGVLQGDNPEDWWQWWYDENEVTVFERPVTYTLVQDSEVVAEIPRRGRAGGDCLIEGTPVWTAVGPRSVESVTTGDRVLCTDIETRKLEYRSVIQLTQRPATPTFKISLGEETVQASGGHLFWVEGKGWTKTRDLKPDMQLKTAALTPTKVTGLKEAESVELYNLIVEGHSNYFVGDHGILSHDGTIRQQGEKSVESNRH